MNETPAKKPEQPAEGRLPRVMACIETSLRELRNAEDSAPLANDLATILRARLGATERSFLLAASLKAANPVDAVFLHDFLGQILAESEELDALGAQAQLDRWAKYCANRTPYEKRRTA